MSETLEQIAQRIDLDLYDDGVVRTPQEHAVAIARRLVAELAKQEPVAEVVGGVGMVIHAKALVKTPTLELGDKLYAAPVILAGWVVVGYLDGRDRFCYADDPHMEIDHTGMRECYAAPKP